MNNPPIIPYTDGTNLKGICYSVNGACNVTGFSRSRIYTFIASGELPTFKVGARTYISHAALSDLVARAERGELASCA